jgi:hypothetical protein
MTQENIHVKISLSFPLTGRKPDRNGVVYTKEAVEKPLIGISDEIPIIDRTNGKATIIGHTCGLPPKISIFSNEKVFFEAEGVIKAGGTECEATAINEAGVTTVTDFSITAIGICGDQDEY